MPKTKLKLALVGSDTMRGRELKDLLDRTADLDFQMEFFDPDVKGEFHKLTDFKNEACVIQAVKAEDLARKSLVFLAADKETNRTLGRQAAKLKFKAVDLSEAFNDDPAIPLAVAGVNDDVLEGGKVRLAANPNPVTIMLAHFFQVARPAFGLKKAVAFVLRPVSAYDDPGIQELASQSASLLSGADPEKKVFDQQIAFNLLSHTEKPDAYGFCSTELQIAAELKRVLGTPDFPLLLSAAQAPVFHTYSIMLFLELVADPTLEEFEAAFGGRPEFSVTAFREGCSASAISVAGREEIFVGRLQKDPALPGAFWAWLVADDLTRGSTLNALAVGRKLLGGPAR